MLDTLRRVRALREINRHLTEAAGIKHLYRPLREAILPARSKKLWLVHDWIADNLKFAADQGLVEIAFAPDGAFIKAVDGIEYWYDPSDTVGRVHNLVVGAPLIGAELDIILKNLDAGSVFFDIGGGIGEYSYNIAKRIDGARAYCFEPTKIHSAYIEKTIARNRLTSRVSCHKLAVSNAVGSFGIASVADGSFVLKSDDVDLSKYEAYETVETTTLDRFVSDNAISRLDFIKADVEGGEFDLLKGADETLRTFKPHLQLELVEWVAERLGYAVKEVFDHLDRLGYIAACTVDEQNRVSRADPGQSVDELLKMGYNFFFHHRDRPFVC